MKGTEDLLQGLIEQLESGAAADHVAANLPNEEAEMIRLIAALRQIPAPPLEEAAVAAQEAELVAAVRSQYTANTAAKPWPRPGIAGLRAFLQNGWAAINNNYELALGLAALVIIIFATWFFAGRTTDSQRIAIDPFAGQPTDPAPGVVVPEERAADETAAPAAIQTTESQEDEAVAAVPSAGTDATFLPLLSFGLESNAETALLENVTGLVQIQTDGSSWQTITGKSVLRAGQRVRTAALSRVTLTFYDGSRAHLSANTELSIDQLDAQRPEAGFRTVVLTQWLGDSEHEVDHRGDSGSRYEVRTPEGSGIARGTRFRVLVTPSQFARYIVTEGKVDVTSLNQTVAVTAGQLTTLLVGNPPDAPTFTITGQGQVSATGSEWTIAGQAFGTHALTLIVGNPQVGDLVYVEGHLLDDGSRLADRIILLRRAVANQFTLTGEVGATGTDWEVAGQIIATNAETVIDEGILTGDTVRVAGIILEDGTLQAQTITRLETAPGLPFRFSGIVQAMNSGSWLISGHTVSLDGETVVEPGVSGGRTVTVEGWILEDDTWLASEIHLLEDELPTFDLTGPIISTDPWVVNGISFETRDWTSITPGLAAGEEVRVQGTILSDGTWVADSITRLNELLPNIVVFKGLVNSVNPWIVNGLPLVVTDETIVSGRISPGMAVMVTAQLLPDGTWIVLSIRPLYPVFGFGCLILSSPVVTVTDQLFQIKHWRLDIKRDGRIKIHGHLKLDSIINLPVCTAWDGTLIIGDIVVIYQPIVVIINPGNTLPPGCRLTSKGSVKCSNQGSSKKS